MLRVVLALVVVFCARMAAAHEVWLDPETWRQQPGAPVLADVVNGQDFEGTTLVWDPRAVARAEAWQGDTSQPIAGRFGDSPALNTTPDQNGLLTLVYQSQPRTVDYQTYEEFSAFVLEKGHPKVLAAHTARKLPPAPVREVYSRFAKSLVAVGDGQGMDAARGLEFEIVALANPYATPAPDRMAFQLIYRNALVVDTQVTLFSRRPDGSVQTTVTRTDKSGQVRFQVTPGTTYLVDAVVLRVPSRGLAIQTGGAVWESLWASLTFQVPAGQ